MTKQPLTEPREANKRTPWWGGLFLILWLLLIYYLSDQPDLGTLTFLQQLGILQHLPNNTLSQEIGELLRYLGHITEYAVLYLLTFYTTRRFQQNSLSYEALLGATLQSLLFCFFFALSDEFHQYFVAKRTTEIVDIMADIFGVFCGQTLTLIYLYLRRNAAPLKK